MPSKKDTEETTEQTQGQGTLKHYLFPNMGADMPVGAQPNPVEAESPDEAVKLNERYLEGLRKQSNKEEAN